MTRRVSDEFLSDLLNFMPDACVVVDHAGQITTINPAAQSLLGYLNAELQGKPLDLLIPNRNRESHAKDVAGYVKHPVRRGLGYGLGLFGLRKDGVEVPVEISLNPIETSEGLRIVAAIRNISQSEERYRAVFLQVAVGVVHSAADGRLLNVNPKFAELTGYSGSELLGLHIQNLVHPEDLESTMEAWGAILAHTRASCERDVRLLRKDGAVVWTRVTMSLVTGAGDEPGHFIAIVHDISGQKEADAKVRRLNRVYAVLSGINSLIVRATDRKELLEEACRIAVNAGEFSLAWTGMLDPASGSLVPAAWEGVPGDFVASIAKAIRPGAPGGGLVGRAFRELQPAISNDLAGDPGVIFRDEIIALGTRAIVVLPFLVGNAAVGMLSLHSREAGVFDDEEMRLLIELANDIAFALDHLEKADRVNYLAFHDPLTGLPNRNLFRDRLDGVIAAAEEEGTRLALAVFDIERFRTINATLGREAGDQVLGLVAERNRQQLGDRATMARIGADLFAGYIPYTGHSDSIVGLVDERQRAVFGSPFRVGDTDVRVSVRTGMAVFPEDGHDADALLRSAEAALREAKVSGDRYLFFRREMTERASENLNLLNQLRHALERNEFYLCYQPKVDLRTRDLVGVEALLRWKSPDRGLVLPGTFIQLLEETGLILDVGLWAMTQAVVDHARWVDLGLPAPRVAVNISTFQLRQPNVLAVLREVLARGSLPPGLDLEITETRVMERLEENIQALRQIRELGVHIAIDDFGTGYSSLAYLTRLPVQSLKIDRSFVHTMLDDPNAMTLVQTVISLAHTLRLTVTAEGVETEEQAKVLRLLRCDEMQGFLLGQPKPFDEMTAMLSRGANPA